ncbi:Pseudoazurin [Rhodovastum atsumiense]|uniref:Pseudoazurin n=1 Tax=Rhodovastum atsumiense TaxID=504468 RepID=A0A5M6IWD9_9PROT|nr:pseudoazurin [Rhodovastum atsumiense]KAA5612640.1 pseudoazurin [Rhodovastum atsumiense]CAH2601372.1 Pseudoazurin [Rhodovastum atsumiense]
MRLPVLLLLLAATTAAHAERYEVKMLNRNDTGGMVYEPDYLRLQPGDSVKFLATSVTHNAASILEMLPAGAESFKGRINEEIDVTFTQPGTYGIRCIPHYMMGMVMLVQVGDASLDTISVPDTVPVQARKRFEEIIVRARQAQQAVPPARDAR